MLYNFWFFAWCKHKDENIRNEQRRFYKSENGTEIEGSISREDEQCSYPCRLLGVLILALGHWII